MYGMVWYWSTQDDLIKQLEEKKQGLTELGTREVELGVILLELVEHFGFFLFIAGGQPLSFLALIVHHFFDHGSSFAIEVGEFACVGFDAGDVDFGLTFEGGRPPVLLVDLIEVDGDLAIGGVDDPGGFVHTYGVRQVALDGGLLPLHTDAQAARRNAHIAIARLQPRAQRHHNHRLVQLLTPRIPLARTPIIRRRLYSAPARARVLEPPPARARLRALIARVRITYRASVAAAAPSFRRPYPTFGLFVPSFVHLTLQDYAGRSVGRSNEI